MNTETTKSIKNAQGPEGAATTEPLPGTGAAGTGVPTPPSGPGEAETSGPGAAVLSPEEAEAATIITDMTTPRPDPDQVWSSNSPERESQEQERRPLRRSTLTWGLILLVLGGLLVAFGFGVHIDPAMTSIMLLASTGVLGGVGALSPPPRTRAGACGRAAARLGGSDRRDGPTPAAVRTASAQRW